MEKEKQETLSTLYALRAGMSTLSLIADVAIDAKDEIENCDKKLLPALNKKLENLDIEEERNEQLEQDEQAESLEQLKQELADTKNKLIDLKNHAVKSTNDFKKTKIKTFITLIITLIVELGLIIGACFEQNILIGWAIVCFIPAIVIIVKTINKYNDEKLSMTCAVDVAKADTPKLEARINELKDDIKYFSENQSSVSKTYNSEFSARKHEIENEIEECKQAREDAVKTLQEQYKKFQKLYASMKKQFSGFLDERDWKNVDLIIFNYETGRALDLRDALIQVDMERRNEQLVSAMKYATSEISQTIKDGLDELDSTISAKYCLFTDGLTEITEISSAQEVLLEKASTSSEDMSKNIVFMKALTDKPA